MQVSKIEHTCGMLTFPITFLIGDLLSEYFGTQVTRKTVYMGLWMSMLVFCVMNLAQELPHLKKPYNGMMPSIVLFILLKLQLKPLT